MKIKEAIIKRCDKCNSYLGELSPEVYGCDNCKKIIDLKDSKYGNKICPHLEITIFLKDSEKATYHQLCSWKCCFEFLTKQKKRKDIALISIPCLSWERDIEDKYVGDFFECLK